MQRGLKIAIAVATLMLLALLGRRMLRAASMPSFARDADPFTYVDVDRSVSAVGADLRSSGGVLGISRDRHGRACEGDADALSSVTERARRVLEGGEPRDEVRAAMVALAQQCFDPAVDTGLCRWAAHEVDVGGDLSDIAWSVLAACPSGRAAPYFDRADAPADDVIAFVSSRMSGVAALEAPPRLPSQYARAVIENASLEARSGAPSFALQSQVRYDDPAATEALLGVYETAPDRTRRIAIARALAVLSSARARDVERSACLEELGASPELCAVAEPPETVARVLDSWSYVARHPAQRELVLAELDSCARGEDDELPFGALCLRDVAELDWQRAREIASDTGGGVALDGVLGGAGDPARDAFVRTLERFPSAESMVLALRSRGLLGEPRPMGRPPVTLGQTMVAYGRGWSLAEASPFGAGHDRLARHLARLARPVLDDVVFDEVLPDAGEILQFAVEVELVAYGRSERFAALASSDGEFYDLATVVGLLNVLLRERGSELRYLIVEDAFAPELVVLGPAPALLSAIDDELFVPVDPDDLGL